MRGLFTDLYEFTMCEAYLAHGMTRRAVFDLHVRSLPPDRGYLVSCGLSTLLSRLKEFRFEEKELQALRALGFSRTLLRYLEGFRFRGKIRAVPEGRLVFPYEPILEVEAELPMAQLVETLVLNTMHLETMLASKAARVYDAVRGTSDGGRGRRPTLVDFGARRAHGGDAAIAAARAAYVSGFDGSSLVEANRRYGIPCFGTMAHSFVQAFPSEEAAFDAFAETFPDGTTLLIDTYETERGARRAIAVARRLAARGHAVGALRIDSGDLAAQARRVRTLLNRAGLPKVRIFASGNLDEHRIRTLLRRRAPIDGFGVGTSYVVSRDLPALDIAYKLCEYDGEPVMKASAGKRTLPGAKQVWRKARGGRMLGDTIAPRGERHTGQPLLQEARTQGASGQGARRALRDARRRFLAEFARLPEGNRRLAKATTYPVRVSPSFRSIEQRAMRRA
ncbi:MAG: nicotinate phosphoribosyltransferase [Methanobacteriota archaeon]